MSGHVSTAIEILIIVPARCGSKGIPDKNIKSLAGKPLLQWTIDALITANIADSLAILSTDSPMYAELGTHLGLQVPFIRPQRYATDQTPATQVVQHTLGWFGDTYGYLPKYTMWLQPTSPFRSTACIRQAVAMIHQTDVEAVIGCKEIHRDPSTLFRCENGFLSPLDKQAPTQTHRQQIQSLLTPNGAMYLCNSHYLKESASFYPPNTVPLIMNGIQSLDIDSDEDWAIAEAFVQSRLV